MTETNRLSPIIKCVLVGLWIAITGAIVYGHFHELFYFAGFCRVMSTLWGKLVLFDFSLSLMIIGAWIYVIESDKRKAIPLALAVLILGCPVALAYLLVRSQKVQSLEELFLRRLG